MKAWGAAKHLTNRVQADAVTTEVGTPGTLGPILYPEVTVKGNLSQQLLLLIASLYHISCILVSDQQALALPGSHTAKVGNTSYTTEGDRGGGKELIITAQISLTFQMMATVQAFIEPYSEMLCSLGMNVLPPLEVTFLQANGEFLHTGESLPHNPTTSQVHLVQTSYVSNQKVTLLEAVPDYPLQCHSFASPAQEWSPFQLFTSLDGFICSISDGHKLVPKTMECLMAKLQAKISSSNYNSSWVTMLCLYLMIPS